MFRRKNDILLKSAFEEAFPEFLRFYVRDAETIFDFVRGFEFMDKELQEITPEVEKSGGTRFADLLVKTWLLNGTSEWILIHIEIQGTNDASFAKRMFTYYYRALDRFNVPVTAFAIFTGGKTQKQPSVYSRSFLGTELTYRYNTYHVLDQTESELLKMDNAFALIVLAAQKVLLSGKIPEQEIGEQRWTIAKAFIESGKYSKEKMLHFLWFLKNFVQVSDPEINAIFDRRVNSITNNVITMDMMEAVRHVTLEEGIERGRQEMKEVFITNLIVQLGLSDEVAAKVAEVPVAEVKSLRSKLEQHS